MDERLFQVIMALIPVLGAIVTYFVIPYIKTLASNEQLKQYKAWADMAVKCAEMLWKESGMGADKKAYAVQFLSDMFNKNKIVITEEQLNILIEAAVLEMNRIKVGTESV